jgi:hypothetical protein
VSSTRGPGKLGLVFEPDHVPEGGRWGAFEWMVAGTLVLAMGGAFAADIATDFAPIKLTALVLVTSRVPMLVVHEMGHALVAWALGWRVRQIVLGFGKVLGAFDLGGARVEIRAVPLEGFVTPEPRDGEGGRAASALVYAAGPLAELAVLAAMALSIGLDRFVWQSSEPVVIACQAVAIGIVGSLVANAIPHGVRVGGRLVPNDGLGVVRSLLGRR